MKVLEILLIILLIILIYPGIDYLKKASQKGVVANSGTPPEKFTGSDYFKPQPIWQDNKNTTYLYGGVSVLGTGICRIYTYEQPLVGQKTDKYGNYNLLNNVSYVKPNIDNSMIDFVNGNSHLSGKITDINKDQSTTLIDIDQVNVKFASKVCGASTGVTSENRCLTNKGETLQHGETFSYTVDCNRDLNPGIIGCISLNYIVEGDTISNQTKCISIRGISVPESVESVYDLDFYRQLGIINKLETNQEKNDRYPVQLGLDVCNNTDARQKFKIIRYTSLGTSTNTAGRLKEDPTGSYASFIFRGLNSYLDMEDGNFQLVDMTGKDPTDAVKWIFFPETKLTDNTIPSTQRCVALSSNIYSDPSLIPSASAKEAEGAGGADAAAGLARNAARVIKVGRYVANKIGNAVSFRGNPNTSGPEEIELQDFAPGESEELTAEATSDAIADSATGALASISALAGPLAVVLLLVTLLSLIFGFLPDPTYDKDNPFTSYGIEKGSRVTPSNFLGDITANSEGTPGEAIVVPLDKFCTQRELPVYPPYFLEAVTSDQQIETKLINYDISTGIHFSGRQFFTGGADKAYGIFIWNNINNHPASPINKIWKDGDTAWEVKPTLSEAIVYPKNYFVDTNLNSVETFSPTTSNVNTSVYKNTSKTGLISKLDFSKSNKSFSISGRLPGFYTGTSPSTSNTSAKFDVSVINTYTTVKETKTKVNQVFVSDPGSKYKEGDDITIEGTEIGGGKPDQDISFGVSTVANEVFIFKALNKYSDNNYYLPEDTPPKNTVLIEGGFEISAEYTTSGSITFNTDLKDRGGIFPTGVISNGSGYTKGSELYLIQYTYTGIKLTEYTKTATPSGNLIKLTVESVTSSSYSFDSPAPAKLIDNETSKNDFKLNYNFMDNAKNFYDVCPQQIVYGGEMKNGKSLIDNLTELVKGNLKSKNIQSLFLANRDPETGLLNDGVTFSPLNLKSLQLSTLKYKSVPVTDKFSVAPENVLGSSIILGRFIPYKSFEPAYSGKEDRKNILTSYFYQNTSLRDAPIVSNRGLGDALVSMYELEYDTNEYYYNQNSAEIIPYGIPDIYSNAGFVKNSPKF